MVCSIVVIGVLTCCVLLLSMHDLKAARMNFENLGFKNFNWAITQWKQPKIFVEQNVKVQQPDGLKKILLDWKSLDNQGQIDINAWILRLCSKL